MKIARLAVDSHYRDLGIGLTLVDYAVALIHDRIAENVDCRFVVTDAKSEAIDFYLKQSFILLDSEGNQSSEYHLYLWICCGLGSRFCSMPHGTLVGQLQINKGSK